MTIPDLFVEFAPNAGPFDVIGETYMTVDGTVEGAPSTPDSASYDNLTDLDIRIDCEADFGRSMALVGKWDGGGIGSTSDANQRSFVFWSDSDGLSFSVSEDGTNAGSFTSSSYSDTSYLTRADSLGDQRLTLRVTFDADNGASGYTSTFYTGPSIDGPWTQYGVPYTSTLSGTITAFNSTADLRVGEILYPDNAMPFVGKIYEAQVYSGTNGNTTLVNPNFAAQASGTLSFTDGIGKPWTLGAGSDIVRYDWTDLSDDVIAASWGYGRDDELEHFPAGEATIILSNDDRTYDPEYSAGPYYGSLLPRVPFRILSGSVGMSNGTGNASTPDHASYSMSDIDVRVHCALDDYTPVFLGRFLASQYASNNIAWSLILNLDGAPLFQYSTDGSTAVTVTCSATVGVANEAPIWLRCAFDSDVGGVSNQTYFYTSDDGVDWTQLGTTQTHTGAVSIFNSTADLSVGAVIPPGGFFYEMDLRSGIDSETSVANPKFYEQAVGATTFTDSQTRVWTLSNAEFDFNNRYKLDQFYGFVENGWEQQLYPPEGSNCQVRLVDKLGVLAGYALPDVMDYFILLNGPVGYWVLDGPTGSEAVADLAAVPHDGTVEGAGIEFGSAPIGPGHPTSARFSISTSVFGQIVCNDSPINSNSAQTRSVVVTFRVADTSSHNYNVMFVESDGLGTGFGETVLNMRLADTNGLVEYQWVNAGGGVTYIHRDADVLDGNGHIAIGTGSGLYVDTDERSQSTGSGVGIGGQGVGIGGLNGIAIPDHFDGWIGAVALYNRNIGGGEVTKIIDGYNKLNGQRSDEQVLWSLNRLRIPASFINLDTGYITMGAAETAGRDMLEWIREVTATEGGAFYIDHRDGGKFRFTNRYHRFTESRSTTSQMSFSDDPDASFFNVVRVEREDLDIAPNGIDSITNQITVTWRGGELVVSDEDSIARYGPRARQLATQATVAAVARSAGEWVIAKYVNPQLRIKQIRIYPGAAVTAFKAALNLMINDRVTYRSHPQMVGSAIESDLYVDGIMHVVERGVDWKTTYRLAQADVFTPWMWDVSAWDTETYWG